MALSSNKRDRDAFKIPVAIAETGSGLTRRAVSRRIAVPKLKAMASLEIRTMQ